MLANLLVCLAVCVSNWPLVLSTRRIQNLTVHPTDVRVEVNETANITYQSKVPLESDVRLYLNQSEYFKSSSHVTLAKSTGRGVLSITGRKLISLTHLEVATCTSQRNTTKCNLNIADAFVRVTVIKSQLIHLFTIIVGWMYFAAWSLSFYPQIILNFRRKSVTGLNFDFLLLNIIGFAAYSIYNMLMYFDTNVQDHYKEKHPKSPIPVLLNDVVFAVHAFLACVVTAIQCFLYERENQRVSRTCMVLSTILILLAAFAGLANFLELLNVLQFVITFSYIKMIVTLSKYFPQTFFNFKRKSTVGWSIGNVLLDFTGGSLDILQMVLQCINVDDWVAFYGNPVKFGLGLVSIIFDIIFMLQHYVLYRGVKVVHAEYEGVENPVSPQSPETPTQNHEVVNHVQDPILNVQF
uniref:Cystinosin homolog n=1 Tax=Haemonchus contortus TaxID=6289 RepID=A0A7I4Y8F7_HAECO